MYVQLIFAIANKQALLRQDFRKDVLNSAEKYVNNNSSEKVAEMFIKLFRD